MKKFEFRLEQVLKIRHQQEIMVQKEFAKVQAEHKIEVAKLTKIFDDKRVTFDSLKDKQRTGFDSTIYMAHMKFIEKLNLDIDIQRINVSKKEAELSKKRKELLEAVKKRKILENLKEKKLEEYNYEMNQEEQKFLDDISQRLYFNKA